MSWGEAKRALWLALLGAFLLLAVSGCASDGGGQAKAQAIPQPGKPLAPGKYTTKEFEPRLSFEVGKGWRVAGPEYPSGFGIAWRDERAGPDPSIIFLKAPSEVFSRRKPEELAPVPAPEDWVAWFRGHPYLEVGKPQAASVGGIEGRQFTMSVDLLPGEDYNSAWCGGDRLVPLWQLPEGGAVCHVEGTVDRIIVLEDVGGKTVLIDVGAEASKFEDFVPQAEKVLDTVEWRGT
jgi:hypothetical protein